MTTSYDLPMPGERWSSNQRTHSCVIVASCWFSDDTATILVLDQEPPFYSILSIEWSGGGWVQNDVITFDHIAQAAFVYAEDFGGEPGEGMPWAERTA